MIAIGQGNPAKRLMAGICPQLSRYSIASVVSLAVDLAIYTALCAFSLSPTIAAVTGYVIGMVVNYALSVRFVFETGGSLKSRRRTFAEFAASGLLGLLITTSVVALMTEWLATPASMAKFCAIVLSFFAVFLIRRYFVFASPRQDGPADSVYSKSGFAL
jgi:putative flippase GtrA